MKPRVPAACHGMAALAAACGASMVFSLAPLRANLLSNLEAFHSFQERLPVGNPRVMAVDGEEGPKCLATADFNGDGKPDLAVGNLDGTVTVLMAQGGGHFASPVHLNPSARELRSVLAADLNGDDRPDIAAASPQDGQIAIFFNAGDGAFGAQVSVPGWIGVRSLATGDFDGDGVTDLAAAGPGAGVRHFRGLGQGAFQVMGDLPRLSPKNLDLTRPRPVYVMRTIRSRDAQRDDLLVTHADSTVLWILSTVAPDRSQEPPVQERRPEWTLGSPPVVINEVQVHNTGTLLDEDGTAQPWAELLNRSPSPVSLSGWKLKLNSASWNLPAVTLEPGRFLTVFLSGKNRTSGPALHASFLLKENTDAIHLDRPGSVRANTIELPPHTVTGVSRGLAPDNGTVKWFDIPSPAAENNAGLSSLDNLAREVVTTLTITPAAPSPAQPAMVRVATQPKPTGSSSVKVVWLAVTNGLSENYHLLRPVAPGLYEEELPPGAYAPGMPHRVLARIRDDPPSTNDYTAELYRGGMSAEGYVLPAAGSLLPIASVPCDKSKSFETGPILNSWQPPGTAPDLVYANDEDGLLRVLRAAPDARRFSPFPAYEVQVPGVPRDVKLGDMDADGWLDALVVLREKDVAVTCRNDSGMLKKPSGELQAGTSPREAVLADFNGDALPDAAVINRDSGDVSVLLSRAAASGLVSPDQVYSVDGDVAAMVVRDFNGDNRADVLQLLRASSELSLRMVKADGRLAPPVYHPVGAQGASAMAVADVDNDGIQDVVTANLGSGQAGSVSVILGLPGGRFAAPRVIDAGASLFAIAIADFNNDGNADLVTGLWDCRVKFFHGTGQGDFTPAPELPVPFIFEARVMVTSDFDQDGDVDIAGAGIEGDMGTLENNLNQTTPGPQWIRRHYPQPDQRAYGANRIGLTRLNDDGDPDLLIGAGHGILLFEGRPGMDFRALTPEEAGDPSTGLPYAISDVLSVDIDGDGQPDMVASCRQAACLDVLSLGVDGRFVRTFQADVPASRFLATGYLDGDLKPDLVGSGDVLWTVLSSRPPEMSVPDAPPSTRPRTGEVVINEVLPRNTSISVPADNRRNSDYVELFNGGPPMDLTNWKVRVESNQQGSPIDRTWMIPPMPLLATQARLLIIFAELDTLFQPGPAPRTGFTLPAEGGTLTLLRPDNSEANRVVYPRMQENVSWSRFLDGHPSFHVSPVPTPGLSNVDNGRAQPEVQLIPPSPAAMRAGTPITWTARGRDDVGIISLSLIYNRLDAPWPEPKRVNLYDNGEGADAPRALDGLFHGTMNDLFPSGAQVQFYLEAVDLSGARIRMPEVAELSAPGQPPVAWSFAITEPPTLEISEVCARNDSLLRDERGGHSDYVKVRNTGNAAVDMSKVVLAHSPLSDNSGQFTFPSGLSLAPGAEVTVFADGNPSEGPMHAPFTLSAEGEDLSLFALLPSGARIWIDSLSLPPSEPDARFQRLPGTDVRGWIGPVDHLDAWAGTVWDKNGHAHAAVRFLAEAGTAYRIEGDHAGNPVEWTTLSHHVGDGTIQTITMDMMLSELTALRCVRQDQFQVKVDAAMPGHDGTPPIPMVAFFGRVPGAVAGPFEVVLELSENPDFSSPIVLSAPVVGTTFEATATRLRPGMRYHYRAMVPGVGGGVWSAPGASLTTPASETGMISSLGVNLDFDFASLKAFVSLKAVAVSSLPEGASLSFLVGPRDEFHQVEAWPIHAAPSAAAPLSWTTVLTGLNAESEYFARVLISSPAGNWVSPQRVPFRPLPQNNALPAQLTISEIMYHPPPLSPGEFAAGYDSDDLEFVELHNPSAAPVDLSGMWFDGIDFDFPSSGAPIIPPGGYAVIAAHPHAFALRYGPEIPLAGWTLHPFRRSKLSNGGEWLRLHRADGTPAASAYYSDWTVLTDGGGYSLEWSPTGQQFVTSVTVGGTPGLAGLVPYTDWLRSYFNASQISNPGISAKAADPDRDGLNNHAEFVLGTDPLRRSSSSPLQITNATPDGTGPVTLVIELNRFADHTGIHLQFSPALGRGNLWSAVGTIFAGVNYHHYQGTLGLTHRSFAVDKATLVITLWPPNLPGGPSPDGFFRLRITP